MLLNDNKGRRKGIIHWYTDDLVDSRVPMFQINNRASVLLQRIGISCSVQSKNLLNDSRNGIIHGITGCAWKRIESIGMLLSLESI